MQAGPNREMLGSEITPMGDCDYSISVAQRRQRLRRQRLRDRLHDPSPYPWPVSGNDAGDGGAIARADILDGLIHEYRKAA
jgi:hypothetical protein